MNQQVAASHLGADTCATDTIMPPGSGVSSRQVRLAALPSAVPWARRVLRHALGERQLEELLDTALLLVSELVTNAVQAAARRAWRYPGRLQMITLSLQMTETRLVAEVWDASPGLPKLQEKDLLGEHGRGLVLVDFLADEWGYSLADGGKVVWCTVATRA